MNKAVPYFEKQRTDYEVIISADDTREIVRNVDFIGVSILAILIDRIRMIIQS